MEKYAPFELLLVVGLATLSVVIVVLPVLARRRFDPFHPLCIVGLGVLSGTTVRAWYILFVGYDDPTTWTYLEGVVSTYPIYILLPGAALIAMGTVCVVFGYLAIASKRLPIERLALVSRPWHLQRSQVLAVISICIALLVLVDFLARTDFRVDTLKDLSMKRMAEVESHVQRHTALMYHRILAHTVPAQFFYVLLISYLRRPERGQRILPLAVGCGFVALLLPFLSSERTSLIVVMINALVIWSLHRRIGMRHLGVWAAVALAIIIGMWTLRVRDAAFSEVSYSARQALFENENGIDIVKTGHMYRAVPSQVDYQLGRTMMMWVFSPIPRSLWPDKPETNLGYVVSQSLYRAPPDRRTGSDPGVIAELYLNCGVPGVVVGTLLFGALLRVFWNTFRPLTQTSGALMMYVVLLMPLSNGVLPQEVSQGVMAVGIDGLVCCLILLAIGSGRQGGAAAPPAFVVAGPPSRVSRHPADGIESPQRAE